MIFSRWRKKGSGFFLLEIDNLKGELLFRKNLV